MNDLLFDEIQAAYQTHNLSPIRSRYSLGSFACPLTVLAIHRGGVDKNDPCLLSNQDDNPAFSWACEEFGEQWAYGFMNGLDEQEKTSDDAEYLAGYALGSLALEQLFPHQVPV
jgi:hypothetical protein